MIQLTVTCVTNVCVFYLIALLQIVNDPLRSGWRQWKRITFVMYAMRKSRVSVFNCF